MVRLIQLPLVNKQNIALCGRGAQQKRSRSASCWSVAKMQVGSGACFNKLKNKPIFTHSFALFNNCN